MQGSYYDASAHLREDFPRLAGVRQADVCIVGGGYTGLIAALELRLAGFTVTLLEARRIGFGASGRNGGQIATGYSPGMCETADIVGAAAAKQLWDLSVEASAMLRAVIRRHDIDCDLQPGEFYAAIKPRHRDWLHREQEYCERAFGYTQYRWWDTEDFRAQVVSDRFCGALYDEAGGHLHPLNYLLGLGRAAKAAGVEIFEHSEVLNLREGTRPVAETAEGRVTADFVILAGNAYLGNLQAKLAAKFIPVDAYIIATEPLGQMRARAIMNTDACVSDMNYNLDYFRLSADTRLLYGGRDKVIGHRAPREALRANMVATFPGLADVAVDYVWGGKVAITRNLLPDVGRIGANIYYAQGYSGQGVPLSAIVGRLLAEAISGQAARFDVFARIPHKAFPGGTMLRRPLLSLARLYYELRDAL
ncbi:NAD(P)/FAD-dependent oxidoreductase [Sneathiella sp.]|uniref:NAD(P)/FAD-dependent oxidoreductase n=1 Tax=Sneathiella sp. TaxID=1964365 RepID=UPI002FE147B2